jgi:hypothetical protein
MLDEREFLSPFGIRALSRRHLDEPYCLEVNGVEHRVDYEPGESSTGLFGGNSNWRGPVWFPVNFLLVESLQKFHHYVGDGFTVEFPTGSGRKLTLAEVAAEISRRLSRLFLRDEAGRRPAAGDDDVFNLDPHWRDLVLFHEYFHGDTGRGLGASHQTGWTGAIAKLIQLFGSLDPKKALEIGKKAAFAPQPSEAAEEKTVKREEQRQGTAGGKPMEGPEHTPGRDARRRGLTST